MHKHGTGDVAQPDPQDPQGVPVSNPQAHTAATDPTAEQRQAELDEENRATDGPVD